MPEKSGSLGEDIFFILGAEKCATTSIYYYCKQHPEIFVPERTQAPNVLSTRFDKRFNEFEKIFRSSDKWKILGIETAGGLCTPEMAGFLYRRYPKNKLVVSMRNPVDRAYSHWWMHYEEGKIHLPFEQAIIKNTGYMEEGKYARQIRHFLKYFPLSQLKLILFEDFCKEPEVVTQDLFRFLGVDPEVKIEKGKARKVGMGSIGVNVTRAASALGIVKFVPREFRQRIRECISLIDTDKPSMKPETRRRLLCEFKPYNKELEYLLGWDLSIWSQ